MRDIIVLVHFQKQKAWASATAFEQGTATSSWRSRISS